MVVTLCDMYCTHMFSHKVMVSTPRTVFLAVARPQDRQVIILVSMLGWFSGFEVFL